jgi:4-hydroxy-2-oxoheptanedioate aldolase
MQHETRLHRCIADRTIAAGFFTGLGSPALVDLLAHGTTLDFLAVELQHAPIDAAMCSALLRAMQTADPDVTPIVRLPDHSVYWIQQSLDAGYIGLIAPLVESADQARELVRAAYFPPIGARSFAGSVRASMYGIEPDQANEHLILLPQIESARGLEHVEEIVAVKGITGVLFGPEDMSLDCGWRGRDLWTHPPFMDAVERVVSACRKHDKPAATLTGAPLCARDAGFNIIGFGGDTGQVRIDMVTRCNEQVNAIHGSSSADNTTSTSVTAPTGNASRRQAYRACIDRFNAWVGTNLRAGAAGWRHEASADAFFSLSVYGSQVGRRDWSLRALSHIQRNFIDEDGILKQGANRDQMTTYVPAWLAWASFDTEVLDLGVRLLDFICGFQDPSSGGFFAGEAERKSQKGLIDFDGTTISMVALARGGRVEPAVRGAEFLLNLREAQPAPDQQFCTAWSAPDTGLIEPQQAAATTILRWDQPQQHYYKVGLFVVALTHVYGVTGERRFLDAATTLYQDTVERAADLWTNTISHKMCWAAITLHSVTGQPEYIEHACLFADHLIGLQQSDGTFSYPEFWDRHPPDNLDLVPNIGPQFALWITRVLRVLEADQ